ncbi:MAG: phosphomannomutase/phosphoglucomutase [Thiohalocapsa sp.]|nr:phosphomannomutase/phosphoglucomutase [Thiohalocapsa sp.]MCF7991616.1 phosphomannomutase/phosphoglucomutase [Thiohalocapsa sp.]
MVSAAGLDGDGSAADGGLDLPDPLRFDFDDEKGDDGGRPPDGVFRAYDIRGLVDSELDEAGMEQLGQAVGSEARTMGSDTCVVARDLRPSSERLCRGFVTGLMRTGCNVIDLGIAPIPVVYHTAQTRGGVSGAMVTASHNPVEYNGLKFVLAGQPSTEAQIAALRERIRGQQFFEGEGSRSEETVFDAYIEAMTNDITLARRMKLVVDCGHGTASVVAARLFRALGCEVIELDCDPDRAKIDPRMADPAQPSHLGALGDAVRNVRAELGVGFDPDADRLGVIDSAGRFVAADRVLMLLAADVLARRPGSDIVYDVKCSPSLAEEILRNGGRPVMWKSGHSYLKQKLRETGGAFGGELSGHIVFCDRWNGFDDALYAAARLLEVLALDPRPSAEIFAALPLGLVTPELFAPLPEQRGPDAMKEIVALAGRLGAIDIDTLDGLRASFEHGWGVVRASNTQSGLVFRFEGRDPQSLQDVQEAFRGLLHQAVPGLALPF